MSRERLYTVDKRSLYKYISRTFRLHFYNIKGSLDSEMSKERLYTIDKRSLLNYISRTFRLNFIILLNFHYTLKVSNERLLFTIYSIKYIYYKGKLTNTAQ